MSQSPPAISPSERRPLKIRRWWILLAAVLGLVAVPLYGFYGHLRVYGKVVDQNGDPVPGAEIHYICCLGILLAFKKPPPELTMVADGQGRFRIHGPWLFDVTVWAGNKGYVYFSDEAGDGVSSNWQSIPGHTRRGGPDSSSDHPAILTLEKMGKAEPLVRTGRSWQPLQPNGPVMRMPIGTDPERHVVDFTLQAGPQPAVFSGIATPYRWTLTVRAPHGTIQVRPPHRGYTAPETGYLPEIVSGYPEGTTMPTGEEWRWTLSNQDYYVRFDDGTSGRICFDLATNKPEQALLLEAWFNPAKGSRQLAPGDFPWPDSVYRKGALVGQ